jgi:hypothetical protein
MGAATRVAEANGVKNSRVPHFSLPLREVGFGENPPRARRDAAANLIFGPEAGHRKPEAHTQYSAFSPGGRVFHLRCTHSHCSGYFRT